MHNFDLKLQVNLREQIIRTIGCSGILSHLFT